MSGPQYSSSNQDQMNQGQMNQGQMNQGQMNQRPMTEKKSGMGSFFSDLFKPKGKTVKELQDEKASCSTIDSRLQEADELERGTSNMQQGSGRKSRKQQGGRRRRTRMSGRKRSGKKRRGRKTRR